MIENCKRLLNRLKQITVWCLDRSFIIIAVAMMITFVRGLPTESGRLNQTEMYETSPVSYSMNEIFTIAPTENPYLSLVSSKKTVESVVKLNFEVKAPYGSYHKMSSATGFSIAYDKDANVSFIVTNNHFCVSMFEMMPLTGRFYYEAFDDQLSANNSYNEKDMFVVGIDETKDLCLLVAVGYVRPVKIAPEKYKPSSMEPVRIIGAPSGIFPIIVDTYVSGTTSRDLLPEHMREGEDLILVSCVIVGGQSGSPIFNRRGQVIGVIFLGLNSGNVPTYGSPAIPLSDLREFLDDNIKGY